MGKRGPLPKKKLKITTPAMDIPPPEWLDENGRREHERAATELRLQGRLTRDCAAVLEGIATAYQHMMEADTQVKEFGLLIPAGENGMKGNPAVGMRQAANTSWKLWLVQAGLTPASLGRIEIKAAPEGDELDTFRITG